MAHGGYHGTQIIGGKITQLGDEFKDSQGNIKPQFSVTGDRDTGFNVSMAKETFNPRAREAMYATPDDVLQNIIDRKDVLKLQPSPDRSGLNVYQDTMQDFRSQSPANMDAFIKRFPITSALEFGPQKLLENTLFGRVLSAAGGAKDKVGEFASGLFPGAGETFRGIAEDLSAAPGRFAEDFKTMVGLKDDNPIKGEVREVLGVKKNTPEDIIESSDVFKTDADVTEAEPFYGGRSLTDELFASQTLPANPDLKFGRQFQAMNQGPEFANYIREVQKRLGI
tara:strand:- start:269 stop:1111 length:843 start_codon:yes stop_codon:yes gene_type:complete